MLNNRYSRAASSIATALETDTYFVADVSTQENDAFIFRVMLYLNRYFGKYSIQYMNNGDALIQKQG